LEVDDSSDLLQGVTALHLAVYKYENSRSLEITRILLDYGADVCLKAAVPPSAQKISIIRKDKKSPHGEILLETKRISLGQKTPLLIALELKSSLYLRGILTTMPIPAIYASSANFENAENQLIGAHSAASLRNQGLNGSLMRVVIGSIDFYLFTFWKQIAYTNQIMWMI